MSKKSVVITGLGALVAGVIIGSAGAASSTTVAEPQVKTVTQTRTVTDRVEVTPQSCLDAIDAAEAISVQTRDYVELTTDLPQMIVSAAKAGMSMDAAALEAVTTDMNDFSSDTKSITAKIGPLVNDFNSAKASCQAS